MKRKYAKQRANVDLIPMIDVVFQLILFFLVSTTFALLPAIVMKLPESNTSESAQTTGITITAESNGKIWLNTQPLSLAELDAALINYPVEAEKRPTFPISLEADESVTNGTIVKILDALRRTGFSAVNLRTTGAQR